MGRGVSSQLHHVNLEGDISGIYVKFQGGVHKLILTSVGRSW